MSEPFEATLCCSNVKLTVLTMADIKKTFCGKASSKKKFSVNADVNKTHCNKTDVKVTFVVKEWTRKLPSMILVSRKYFDIIADKRRIQGKTDVKKFICVFCNMVGV